jgi:hypothetical protein
VELNSCSCDVFVLVEIYSHVSRTRSPSIPVSSGSIHGNHKSKHGSIWTAILPWRRRGGCEGGDDQV